MRRGISKLTAGFLVLVTLGLGSSGGCLIGQRLPRPPHSAEEAWSQSVVGGLIGLGASIVLSGLLLWLLYRQR
jgi:hypothetical protein